MGSLCMQQMQLHFLVNILYTIKMNQFQNLWLENILIIMTTTPEI